VSFLNIIFIAIALALDAFAVAISCGAAKKEMKVNGALQIAILFGTFQAIMPLLGWTITKHGLNIFIGNWDKKIAFLLLLFIGLRMIYTSLRDDHHCDSPDTLTTVTLLTLAVATSIDAFAIGMSFALLKLLIIAPIITIGLITFILSFIGVYIGKKIGHLLENKMEIVGGVILVFIAFKILFF